MKLSFSTLGCPEWTWQHIVDEAARLAYDGLEIRGVEGEFFLPKAKPFLRQNLATTRSMLADHQLQIPILDTSCFFHEADKWQANVDEGLASLELAERLDCGMIRVFGNNVPDPATADATLDLIALGLTKLCDACRGTQQTVLFETHGDFADLGNLLPVFQKCNSPHLQLLWDIKHTYMIYGPDQSVFFHATKQWIKHTHIKDCRKTVDGDELCLLGEGEVPVAADLKLLSSIGYTGWLSLEWEKKWHPQLAEPEIAIPHYINYMKGIMP